MRNLKFRAWDKQDNRMIIDEQDFIPLKVTNKGVLRLSPLHEDNLWSIIDGERFEIMMFSGAKDKNGNEICEGDIIRWHDIVTSDYQITFTYGVFCLDNRTDENFHHHRYEIKEKWEVIGNIYEVN